MQNESKNELARQSEAGDVLVIEPTEEAEAAPEPVVWRDAPPSGNNRSLGRSLRTPAVVGAFVVLAFFGGFGGWATTAPLAGAAIATGTVSPDTQRKIIQHLEGGIVREIYVREGSHVKAGDVLVSLLDTKASSTFEQDAVQRYVLAAQQTRYEAELALLTPEISANEALRAAGERGNAYDPPGLTFSEELEKVALQNKGIAEILEGERQQFHARMQAYGLSLQILEQTIAKARAEIVQLERQKQAIGGQAAILDETVEVYDGLVKQGLESRSKLLSYKAQRAALDDDVVALDVRITADNENITSNELEIKNTRVTRIDQISTDLASIRSQRQTIEERMRSTQDTLNRTTIRSPVDGIVVNLKVHTLGGVVAPGGTVMEVVPANDQLTVDAHIDPNDIDSVYAGQDVRVSLSAVPQREMPVIMGKLLSVSADTLTDTNNGNTYYLGKVEVSGEAVKAANPNLTFVPGMEVELFIMTKERTFLDYLLDPLLRSMNRSFVES